MCGYPALMAKYASKNIIFIWLVVWNMKFMTFHIPYAPWCWYIYLQNWVILFGQMLVNIPYGAYGYIGNNDPN